MIFLSPTHADGGLEASGRPFGSGAPPGAPLPTMSRAAVGTSLGSNPPELDRLAMADDVADGYVVAFGGASPALTATGYTLTYRNGSWTNLTDALPTSPSPRWGESMIYDPVAGEVVLFGGCQILSCDPAFSDTWTFSGGQWHDITSTAGAPPAGRGFAMFAWDGVTGYGVLFGGRAGTTTSTVYFSDTWEFSGGRWTNLTSTLNSTQPSARDQAAMAAMPAGLAILFGGAQSGGVDADTWSFGNGNWTNLTSTSGAPPSARALAMFAPDPSDGYLVLFGGTSAGSYLGDTWTYSGGRWSASPASGPAPTYSAAMTFDAEDGYVLMYGGAISQNGQTGVTNGYWSYLAGEWHLFNPAPAAPLDWIFLLPLAFIALFGLEFLLVGRRQNRRLAELSALMPEPAPGQIRWVPTQPRSAIGRNARISAAVMFGMLIPVSLFLTFALPPTTSGGIDVNSLLFLAGIWGLMLGLPTLVVVFQSRAATHQVGVCDGGVIVQRSRRRVRIPWEYLQPPSNVPRGPWLFFRFSLPGRQGQPAGFGATREQTLAILSHPRATGWVVPAPVRESIGLATPFTFVGGPGSAPASPLVGSPTPAPPRPPLAGPVSPGSAPSVAASPVPLRSGSGGAPTESPARAPQLRRCPNCGTLSTVRAQFCSRCGHRLW
jgi:hypothetical protein